MKEETIMEMRKYFELNNIENTPYENWKMQWKHCLEKRVALSIHTIKEGKKISDKSYLKVENQ